MQIFWSRAEHQQHVQGNFEVDRTIRKNLIKFQSSDRLRAKCNTTELKKIL